MSEAKTTPWFPASAKPARKGVYEVEGGPYPYSYFDGHWNGAWPSARTAHHHRTWFADMDDEGGAKVLTGWRGLARKPR
jgi:hypothetical protein